jgi:hypothetical protein
MATISIQRTAVRSLLYAESTNASRTYVRNDGASDFEHIVIDKQADDSLNGAWNEACAKLREKMHEFLSDSSANTSMAQFDFMATSVPDGVEDNIKMYIVDYMMQDWLASVRPDFRQRYLDRCTTQMDDLLRKLYKKEPPV